MNPSIEELRQSIDQLDKQILSLLNQRASIAQQIGAYKRTHQFNNLQDAEREQQVIARLIAENQGPLSDEAISRLYQQIMQLCLALQQP